MEGSTGTTRIEWISHKGEQILHIDHSQVAGLPDVEAAREFFKQAREEVSSHPPKSVRLLTTMSSEMRFNMELAALEREFVQANTPYMKKSAVAGATAAIKAIIATLRFATGRDIRTFDSKEEALDWLAE